MRLGTQPLTGRALVLVDSLVEPLEVDRNSWSGLMMSMMTSGWLGRRPARFETIRRGRRMVSKLREVSPSQGLVPSSLPPSAALD